MKLLWINIFILSILPAILFSQEPFTNTNNTVSNSVSTNTIQIKKIYKYSARVEYFGDMITHPGWAAGLEYNFLDDPSHAVILAFDVGMRFQPRNNISWFLLPRFGYRFTFSFGLYLDIFLGAGYLHSFLWGDVYEYASGKAVLTKGKSSPYFMPDLNFGFGWNLSRNGLLPVTFGIKLDAYGQYPYNSYVLPCIALRVSASFLFNL